MAIHKSRHHIIKGLDLTTRVWISSARQQELPDTPHAMNMPNSTWLHLATLAAFPTPCCSRSCSFSSKHQPHLAKSYLLFWVIYITTQKCFHWTWHRHQSLFPSRKVVRTNSPTILWAVMMLCKSRAYISLGSPSGGHQGRPCLTMPRKVEINQWLICVLS